jgi:hypothetical protein
METLRLPAEELAEMKQFYQDEYERTSRRLKHITNMLNKLGAEIPENVSGASVSATFPSGDPGSKGGSPPRPRKKTGRKSKWELLIIKRLRQLDKPVTYDELTDEIMAFSKLPEEKRKSTKQAIINVVFRLRSRDRKLDTFSAGTREKYIALKNWFSAPGEIKKEYSARINTSGTAKKGPPLKKQKRAGRKT